MRTRMLWPALVLAALGTWLVIFIRPFDAVTPEQTTGATVPASATSTTTTAATTPTVASATPTAATQASAASAATPGPAGATASVSGGMVVAASNSGPAAAPAALPANSTAGRIADINCILPAKPVVQNGQTACVAPGDNSNQGGTG